MAVFHIFHKVLATLFRRYKGFDHRLYKAGADIVIIPEFVSAERVIKKIEHFLRERRL